MTRIILYVKPGCPWCRLAEDYLSAHGFQYHRIDVYQDRAAYAEMKKLSGQTFTPTLQIGNLILPDFGPDELEKFLEENSIRPD
jgi:glutaredoxin 3